MRFVSGSAMKQDAKFVDDAMGRVSEATDWGDDNAHWLVLKGQTLYLYRYGGTGTSVTVYLECVKWLADYTAASTTEDWFLRHCSEYLFWSTVVEVNYIFKEFVYRQEGNLTPPEKMVESAYNALLDWNGRVITQGTDEVDLV